MMSGYRIDIVHGPFQVTPRSNGFAAWIRACDVPSSLDEVPLEDRFSIRRVALFCDRGCGSEIDADIRADTAVQAYEGLRRVAVDEHG